MSALFDIFAAVLVAIAAMAFAQIGVSIDRPSEGDQTRAVHRSAPADSAPAKPARQAEAPRR